LLQIRKGCRKVHGALEYVLSMVEALGVPAISTVSQGLNWAVVVVGTVTMVYRRWVRLGRLSITDHQDIKRAQRSKSRSHQWTPLTFRAAY